MEAGFEFLMWIGIAFLIRYAVLTTEEEINNDNDEHIRLHRFNHRRSKNEILCVDGSLIPFVGIVES